MNRVIFTYLLIGVAPSLVFSRYSGRLEAFIKLQQEVGKPLVFESNEQALEQVHKRISEVNTLLAR